MGIPRRLDPSGRAGGTSTICRRQCGRRPKRPVRGAIRLRTEQHASLTQEPGSPRSPSALVNSDKSPLDERRHPVNHLGWGLPPARAQASRSRSSRIRSAAEGRLLARVASSAARVSFAQPARERGKGRPLRAATASSSDLEIRCCRPRRSELSSPPRTQRRTVSRLRPTRSAASLTVTTSASTFTPLLSTRKKGCCSHPRGRPPRDPAGRLEACNSAPAPEASTHGVTRRCGGR